MIATLGSFSHSYRAVRDTVTLARRDVVAFAEGFGASPEELDAIRTGVTEAVANAVVHAYDDGSPGHVHVTAAVTTGELWILVADDGCGFQSPARAPGLGWGLALIAHASDDFVLAERAEGGTEARMRFALGHA